MSIRPWILLNSNTALYAQAQTIRNLESVAKLGYQGFQCSWFGRQLL
ncbi:hypothetical protein [Pseudanabaena cinerea]|nr:hypothetical protein [Pseudanabaena cinerea]